MRAVELAPWARTGGKGAFVRLYGMEGVTGLYLAEIPPGGALEPEKHIYEKVITVLDGRGFTEILHPDGAKQFFEWGRGSVFAPPLNAEHRLINGGQEPVRYMAVTNAPLIMDVFHNPDFVFNCDYRFTDRYDGREGYFAVGDKRYQRRPHQLERLGDELHSRRRDGDASTRTRCKGSGVRITQFEMSGNSLIGHMSAWPVGRYHKAHYHGPGAVLLILRSEGYVLIWPKEAGSAAVRERPRGATWSSSTGSRAASTRRPAAGSTSTSTPGASPRCQLAIRYGGRLHPVEFQLAVRRMEDGSMTSLREGGTLIEYEDEDPEIRRRYEAALRAQGHSLRHAAGGLPVGSRPGVNRGTLGGTAAQCSPAGTPPRARRTSGASCYLAPSPACAWGRNVHWRLTWPAVRIIGKAGTMGNRRAGASAA